MRPAPMFWWPTSELPMIADRQADVEAVGHDLGAGPVLGQTAGDREVRQLHGVELVVLESSFSPQPSRITEYGFISGRRDQVS
jgi:hypothetical protein